jgi:glycosyltransferase involved in cell wall biosynthesis
MRSSIKVLHIITSLNVGGAEMMLYKLCQGKKKNRSYVVVSLAKGGALSEKIRSLDIKVISLGLSCTNFFYKIPYLLFMIMREKPQVVQTWLYRADLLGGVLAYIARVPKIIWSIRQSNLDLPWYKYLIVKACAVLSKHIPTIIISNSNRGLDSHKKIGYDFSKMRYIPNGFSMPSKVDEKYSSQLRLGIDNKKGAIVLGALGRAAKSKNFSALVKAISMVDSAKDFYLVIAGRGVDSDPILNDLLQRYNLKSKVILKEQQLNTQTFFSAIDFFILPSLYEGYPNVLGEAMSYGLPCIVTDAGDAYEVSGRANIKVINHTPAAIAEGITAALNLSSQCYGEISQENKKRIVDNYHIENIVEQYERLC